jgi:hypothetical protein
MRVHLGGVFTMTKRARKFLMDQARAVGAPPPEMPFPYPAYASPDELAWIVGLSRRKVYEKIAAGEFIAVKDGDRTCCDVRHALEHMKSLPLAKIKPSLRVQQKELSTPM